MVTDGLLVFLRYGSSLFLWVKSGKDAEFVLGARKGLVLLGSVWRGQQCDLRQFRQQSRAFTNTPFSDSPHLVTSLRYYYSSHSACL